MEKAMLVGRLKKQHRKKELLKWESEKVPVANCTYSLHLFNKKSEGVCGGSYQKVSSSSRDLAWSVDLFTAITEVLRACSYKMNE